MSGQGTSPPAWHPDPYNQAQLRYWDGNVWTGHTSGPAPQAPAAAQPAAAATPPVVATPPAAATPPAVATPPAAATPGGPRFSRGFSASRMRNPKTLAIFLGAFAAVVLVGVLGIALLGRGEPSSDCPPDRVCTEPPQGAPLVNLTVWRSKDLGYALEYNEDLWSNEAEDGRSVTLIHKDGDIAMVIGGVPADEATPLALLDRELDRLGERTVGLTEDTDPADSLFGPNLGYVDGVGGAYSGAIDTPQGLIDASAVVMAAGQRGVNAYVSTLTTEQRGEDGASGNKEFVYGDVDSVLNSFRFPSEGGSP